MWCSGKLIHEVGKKSTCLMMPLYVRTGVTRLAILMRWFMNNCLTSESFKMIRHIFWKKYRKGTKYPVICRMNSKQRTMLNGHIRTKSRKKPNMLGVISSVKLQTMPSTKRRQWRRRPGSNRVSFMSTTSGEVVSIHTFFVFNVNFNGISATVYRDIFASGNFSENDPQTICCFFTESYFRYL